ncbi:uncharacterized protein LOC130777535 [Actinidia eriantha]|uniref:uncharacterized protein LOC130777535 n=1 Tax=Actinidia eriantha TaxID=165200 RepID=UPI002589DEB6|nr:uncharacterized protein LOC130777535 [Actinidia eriantha]
MNPFFYAKKEDITAPFQVNETNIDEKICEDTELSLMLYQVKTGSIFSTDAISVVAPKYILYNILDVRKSSPCNPTSLVRRMLMKMKSQPLFLVEVLCWKTSKEYHYIKLNLFCKKLAT